MQESFEDSNAFYQLRNFPPKLHNPFPKLIKNSNIVSRTAFSTELDNHTGFMKGWVAETHEKGLSTIILADIGITQNVIKADGKCREKDDLKILNSNSIHISHNFCITNN